MLAYDPRDSDPKGRPPAVPAPEPKCPHRTATAWFASLAVLGLIALFTASAAKSQGSGPESVAGHWEGVIEVGEEPVALRLDLERQGETWSGTIDFPQRGALGVPLDEVELDGSRLSFSVGGPRGPRFDAEAGPRTLQGTFRQGDVEARFRLGRETVEPKARAQDPSPPYPYDVEAIAFSGGAGPLAGTLTIPRGPGPHPAVLLISGAGPQNRDGEVFGHRPFLVLADALTRAGVAVLRVDDRGVGGSAGDSARTTLEQLVDDALEAVSTLADHERIDPRRIGLLGHSEGGLVAPLAATREGKDQVAFVVLLGAPGSSLGELMLQRLERAGEAQGTPKETLVRQLELQQRMIELLRADPETGDVEPALREVARRQLLASPGGAQLPAAAVAAAVERTVTATLNPRTRTTLGHDPRPALRSLEVPVLALYGSKDQQVDPDLAFESVGRALASSPCRDVTLRVLPDLNHFFQTVVDGGPTAFGRIEETFAPEALEIVSEWIGARFGS